MGTGASNPEVGVPANPRVLYTKDLAKKERKDLIVDAPVLVDVEHGSLRYRVGNPNQKPIDYNKSDKEKPFEGDNKVDKRNYFYHARLNDFSEKSIKEKEDPFKFMYVQKGPNRAKQKKVFYVYGTGWNAVDGTRTLPTSTKQEGNDYSWPGIRVPNHVYYNVTFSQKDCHNDAESIEDRLAEYISSTANRYAIDLTLSSTETARDVKKMLAVKILKAADMIHISVDKKEIRDEDVIGDFREEEGGSDTFSVTMVLF